MGLNFEDLEELCETVGNKIKETNEKIRMSSGDLTGGDLEYLDKLTHCFKSIKTSMAMMDSEDYSRDNMGSYTGNGYSGRYYSGNGYSGRGHRRDSMGRYTRGRYSRGSENDEMLEQLKDLMAEAQDEKTRQEFQRFINKMESM